MKLIGRVVMHTGLVIRRCAVTGFVGMHAEGAGT